MQYRVTFSNTFDNDLVSFNCPTIGDAHGHLWAMGLADLPPDQYLMDVIEEGKVHLIIVGGLSRLQWLVVDEYIEKFIKPYFTSQTVPIPADEIAS